MNVGNYIECLKSLIEKLQLVENMPKEIFLLRHEIQAKENEIEKLKLENYELIKRLEELKK